jgi:hypothetical protein
VDFPFKDKTQLKKLLDQIRATKQIADIGWLEEKVKEML